MATPKGLAAPAETPLQYQPHHQRREGSIRPSKVAASCVGKPKETVFRKHDNRPVMVPLRCGAKRWGYKHLSDTRSSHGLTINRHAHMLGYVGTWGCGKRPVVWL